jgi:hypothetical protein
MIYYFILIYLVKSIIILGTAHIGCERFHSGTFLKIVIIKITLAHSMVV